jgi:hypothetical protein
MSSLSRMALSNAGARILGLGFGNGISHRQVLSWARWDRRRQVVESPISLDPDTGYGSAKMTTVDGVGVIKAGCRQEPILSSIQRSSAPDRRTGDARQEVRRGADAVRSRRRVNSRLFKCAADRAENVLVCTWASPASPSPRAAVPARKAARRPAESARYVWRYGSLSDYVAGIPDGCYCQSVQVKSREPNHARTTFCRSIRPRIPLFPAAHSAHYPSAPAPPSRGA